MPCILIDKLAKSKKIFSLIRMIHKYYNNEMKPSQARVRLLNH